MGIILLKETFYFGWWVRLRGLVGDGDIEVLLLGAVLKVVLMGVCLSEQLCDKLLHIL